MENRLTLWFICQLLYTPPPVLAAQRLSSPAAVIARPQNHDSTKLCKTRQPTHAEGSRLEALVGLLCQPFPVELENPLTRSSKSIPSFARMVLAT